LNDADIVAILRKFESGNNFRDVRSLRAPSIEAVVQAMNADMDREQREETAEPRR
jgi:hypothetical protein